MNSTPPVPADPPSAEAPRFPRHDPATPAFWEVRYRERFVPWDAGRVPGCLRDWAGRHPASGTTSVLVPGCGSAWEVAFLDEAGFKVLAIDFSPAAIEVARAHLGARGGLVQEADYFGPALAPGSFDIIYERAFLCALPRHLWADWAFRTAQLLRPGGQLIGFFFQDDAERGPPFGLKAGELEQRLKVHFVREECLNPQDSIPVFAGKETWQVWRRR